MKKVPDGCNNSASSSVIRQRVFRNLDAKTVSWGFGGLLQRPEPDFLAGPPAVAATLSQAACWGHVNVTVLVDARDEVPKRHDATPVADRFFVVSSHELLWRAQPRLIGQHEGQISLAHFNQFVPVRPRLDPRAARNVHPTLDERKAYADRARVRVAVVTDQIIPSDFLEQIDLFDNLV